MFNRGFRRDDRNNSFRSNTNVSHGHNAPSLMSVSPWEGGIVPGSGGGSSILGNPQMQSNQNLLTPQAQVLAQNLNILSNLGLLQPQIQSRQPQVLPSLINLGSALNRSMGMNQQHSSFRQINQQPTRGMVINRFEDQRLKYGSRQDGRRSEPFNKNRPRPSQSQTSQQKLQSYRPLNSKVSPLQAARKPTTQGGADALAKARADVRGKRGVKRESEEEVEEDAKKEEGDEIVKKRDWKKEKKSDVIEIDDNDEEKETVVAIKVEKGDEDKPNGDMKEDDAKAEKGVADGEETEESGVESKEKSTEKNVKPAEVIIYSCHVCTKNMPDEGSLNGHLRSMAHKRMMDQLEETYALKVKRIRDQMRINEQQKELDMDMRGRGRRASNLPRGHCKMCDLTFVGNITAHRKTSLHLKLKSFLHPNCVPCGKEFPARMEWDMHKLTVEHLKMVSGIDKKLRKTMVNANANRNEPNYARLVPKFPEGLDSVVANMEEENADKVAAPDVQGEAGTGSATMKYDPTVVAGLNMLVHGQHCGVCNKFFSKRPDALEHCKTRTHFDNYLAMKTKLKEAAEESARVEEQAKAVAEAKAKAEAEANPAISAILKETPDVTSTETNNENAQSGEIKDIPIQCDDSKILIVSLKRTVPRKDEGNWKRSRSVKAEDDEDDADEEDEDAELVKSLEVPDKEHANKVAEELEKYDPLEPTSPTLELTSPSPTLELTSPTVTAETNISMASCEGEGDADNADTGKDFSEDSPVAKPTNKARRGRKRK